MKKLSYFRQFDAEKFFADKELLFLKADTLEDFETKKQIGIKVTALIVKDKTSYGKNKEGSEIKGVNEMENIDIKILNTFDIPSVQPMSQISLVNPNAKVYGEFDNQLSIQCEKIETVKENSHATKS